MTVWTIMIMARKIPRNGKPRMRSRTSRMLTGAAQKKMTSANIQEVQNCITEWNWSFDGYWFMANQKDWDKMDPAVQELLMEKAQEAAQWGRDKLVADEKQIKEDFIASGITITELTPEQHQAFVDAARPAQEYFMEKFGAEACTAWGLE